MGEEEGFLNAAKNAPSTIVTLVLYRGTTMNDAS